ncbi:MAG: ribulose-phosphate 3-epimerase [Parasporobacterium sp.]|nr:ribulose-phosphate 3-epimerase [Parasporobacterium sp.]
MRKRILSPSILAADFAGLGSQIREIREAGAEYVHIDVMDGLFVPSISFGMPVIKSLRPVSDLAFDVHLMIQEPVRYIEEFRDCGADILTVHYEACEDVAGTLRAIREAGMRSGLSIKPKTPTTVLKDYLNLCDMVLLMSVEPGFGGQKLISSSYERAREIDQMISASDLPIDLEIDGGINLDNVQQVLDTGVNVIVAGSAVFKNPGYNTRQFMKILNQSQL